MSCADHQKTINRLIDHEIKAGECAELFAHLGICAECRGFYETILTLDAALDNVHPVTDEMPAFRQPRDLITNQKSIAPRPSSLLFAIVVMLVVTLLFSVDVRIEKPTLDRPSATTSQR